MRRCILLATLCLTTAPLEAQVVDLLPGVRVQIRPSGPGAEAIKGTLISRTSDSLVIATPQGVQYRFATNALAKLAVSHGKSGSAGAAKGLKWGAGIAGPMFLMMGLGMEDRVYRSSTTSRVDTVKAPNPLGMAAFGAVVYGGFGALIGAAIGAEEWRTVSHVSPTISAAPDRVRLGATIRLR